MSMTLASSLGSVCLVLCCLFLVNIESLDVPELCYGECGSRMALDEEDFDVACNDTCKVQKCRDGCDSWMEGISISCQDACAEEKMILSKSWNLYCVMGCNIAISIYISKLKDDLGIPSPPYLVADTRTHDTVTIQWASAPFNNISYLVQWRYEALYHSNDWEYYEPTNLLQNNQLTLRSLQPYTKYRFRVAWILLKNFTPLFSEESVVISTMPHGIPSTAPVITCLTAAGSSRVSVNWDPPTFPNGPVLSYVLYVREYPSGLITIKDVSNTSGSLHYMFNNLKSSTTYIISVATRNNVGEGPADTKNITSPSKEANTSSHHPIPYLVFASGPSVIKQGLRILDDSSVLYQATNYTNLVTGVGLHVKNNIFFISDSEGYVHRVALRGDQRKEAIIEASLNYPRILSVDWLNERLYMAEEDQISRCNFKGGSYEVVLSRLEQRPTDMHVDPYNGYLFWATNDPASGGLYRIDLAEFDLGLQTFDYAQQIVKDSRLIAFSVDHQNFRLLLPAADKNTVVSVALDGSDSVDIRKNSQTSQFTNVKSIAMHQNLFYWTDGHEMFGEEYHQKEDKFYHNAYPIREGPFSDINVHHSQPHPVPLNPVESVQAIFKDNMAKIRWSRPRSLGGLGKGAWQKWFYEVIFFNQDTKQSLHENNLTYNKHTQHNLVPNTTYSIKVRACSTDGKGPWSSEFTGRTLKFDNYPGYPYVLWSAREGLLKSDIVGENVEPLIYKINLNNAHITGINWYNELLFLNTNASWVYVYNMSVHHSLVRLTNVTNAASIAIDWFAPKLYWSSPVQQMISRANLDGSQSEPLPILTMAKQLAIDSSKGYIYWATSHSVECSRLNGADHFVYMKNELFSGKHVMGLTLDFDTNQIYWFVRSYEGSLMYRASLAGSHLDASKMEFEFIGPLAEDNVCGPMWYFNDRLFWLHEHKGALLSDIYGQNVARLQGIGLNELKTLAVVDPTLQPYPDGFNRNSIRVVPSSIESRSIDVEGTWSNFNITWNPVLSINYGSVFYEMKVDDGDDIYTLVTDEPVFVYPSMKLLPPYSPLDVAIKSYTYWASSRQTIVSIRSPMSTPTKPLDPRVYITYKSSPFHDKQDIQADFRWSSPESPNGLILGYQVICWFFAGGQRESECQDKVDGENLQFQIKNLNFNTTYNFQVKAFTKVGVGPYSDVVQAQTAHEYPVPQLLLAKTDTVEIADVDTHQQKLLSSKVTHPAALAYLAHDKRVFWIEEDGALMVSSLDGTNTSLIKHLTSKATSLTVDWIGRQLYWVEVDKLEAHSCLWSMDLSYNSFPQSILNQSGIVSSLEVEPLSSSLLWTVNKDTHSELMICNSKRLDVKPFFWKATEYQANSELKARNRERSERLCNCDPIPVGQAITVDSTNTSGPRILWVDGKFGHIWASDLHGCTCELLVNANEARNNGLPPTSLTVDSARIYWSNKTLGKVYSVAKDKQLESNALPFAVHIMPSSLSHKRKRVTSEEVRGIRVIRAIGDHLQPYPDAVCLFPSLYKQTAKLVSRSSTSLTLFLPPVQRPAFCNEISIPSVLFSVHYAPVGVNRENDCYLSFHQGSICKVLSTYNNTLVIHDLHPFSNYSIRISISNYYSKEIATPGPAAIYQTREGAPTAPTNVSAHPVTPHRIDVRWQSPILPNGHPIWYEVRWRTKNLQKSGQSAVYIPSPGKSGNQFIMSINTTEAGSEHFIIVRAYSSGGDMHSDSQEMTVTTYRLPNNLTLIEVTSHSITFSWQSPSDHSVSQHALEYTQLNAFKWNLSAINESTKPSTLYNFTTDQLNSMTKYKFRLLLTYLAKDVTIAWPQEHYFTFETYGDVPGIPGEPHIRLVNRDVYQVSWDGVNYSDGEELVYELQMRAKDMEFDNWITVYNDSNTQWIVESISVKTSYEFRVRALNEYGASNFSFSTEPFFLPEPGAFIDSEENQVGIIMASSVAIMILITMCFAVIYIVRRNREKEKKMLQDGITPNVADLELATLQELPRHGNFVHQTNALYNLGDLPADEELTALPQIRRDQIIMTKFLGRGAFGEVFEGIAHELIEGYPTKVAIKTLRKGATDHEKEEFLKEAKLMSNFKHEHILQLLGVCFDNNPNFIILELMEGGDLLSFLQSNRPTTIQRSPLTLDDLMGICVEVAQGCKYLEDMHFVHRDLAARNCLVSSHDRELRIVKIGDFGLARDIYKNDYYRKEGEGLLPVRWMAPESLVYGIFTSQSDVWAFGVLLWEVMTFGHQPYPARINIEVFDYVIAGGRLDKPENCPDDLHQVMTSCWSYDPDGRPSFGYCLDALQELQRKSSFLSMAITAVQNQNYLSHSNSGAYVSTNDERNDHGKDTDEQDTDSFTTHSDPIRASDMQEHNALKRSASLSHQARQSDLPEQSSISPLNISIPRKNCYRFGESSNKYLELLADSGDADGYEIPLRALTRNRSPDACDENFFTNCTSSAKQSAAVSFTHPQQESSNQSLLKLSLSPTYSEVFSNTERIGSSREICHSCCSNSGNFIGSIDQSSFKDRTHFDDSPFSLQPESPCTLERENQEHSKTVNSVLRGSTKNDFFEKNCDNYKNMSDDSIDSVENDHWSVSTASTAPCDLDSTPNSQRNSGVSSLSEGAGIELNYIPKSSWC